MVGIPDRHGEDGMDLIPIIVGIALINVAVFLTGCSLAAVRTWRERSAVRHQRPGATAEPGPVAEPRLGHLGRRVH